MKKKGERKRKRKKGMGEGGRGPTLQKEKGFQFQTSHGMNRKTRVPGGKSISRMQRNPCDINLDGGFTAIKAQENKTKQNQTKQNNSVLLNLLMCSDLVSER